MKTRSPLDNLLHRPSDPAFLRCALQWRGGERSALYRYARSLRAEYFPGREIEVRSVVEISNVCCRKCNFCNMSASSREVKRYTLSRDEIMRIAAALHARSRRVLLLQSGENRAQPYIDFVCRCVREITRRYPDMTIILCLGSLSRKQYAQLREAGAQRYILKFETSNTSLYSRIKPGDSLDERLECIHALQDAGFEVGSGNIIGLPSQTIDDIVRDLLFIRELKLTMASTSVFIPGEHSRYHNEPAGDVNLALNYMALLRILYPRMRIPSTSSLETARHGSQYGGLQAGANVVTIHDGTPGRLKKFFPIYSTHRFIPGRKYARAILRKAGFYHTMDSHA